MGRVRNNASGEESVAIDAKIHPKSESDIASFANTIHYSHPHYSGALCTVHDILSAYTIFNLLLLLFSVQCRAWHALNASGEFCLLCRYTVAAILLLRMMMMVMPLMPLHSVHKINNFHCSVCCARGSALWMFGAKENTCRMKITTNVFDVLAKLCRIEFNVDFFFFTYDWQ